MSTIWFFVFLGPPSAPSVQKWMWAGQHSRFRIVFSAGQIPFELLLALEPSSVLYCTLALGLFPCAWIAHLRPCVDRCEWIHRKWTNPRLLAGHHSRALRESGPRGWPTTYFIRQARLVPTFLLVLIVAGPASATTHAEHRTSHRYRLKITQSHCVCSETHTETNRNDSDALMFY